MGFLAMEILLDLDVLPMWMVAAAEAEQAEPGSLGRLYSALRIFTERGKGAQHS
jgi:hypothetical protein